MEVTDLPAVNATLNAIACTLLVTGWFFIRSGRRTAHRNCMVAAFACSVVFLASYLVYHAKVGSVPFAGTGAIRTIYFAILIPHIILAGLVPFLALWTLYRALCGQFERHRRIARITFPIWVFVSVTGVLVYGMLYHL